MHGKDSGGRNYLKRTSGQEAPLLQGPFPTGRKMINDAANFQQGHPAHGQTDESQSIETAAAVPEQASRLGTRRLASRELNNPSHMKRLETTSDGEDAKPRTIPFPDKVCRLRYTTLHITR